MLMIEVPGHIVWVWIWAAILLLGLAGLVGAAVWGRRTHWRNLDEVLRGLGTVSVSGGMLLLLLGRLMVLAIFLLFLALALFVAAAFVPEFSSYLPGDE
jgi:predicted MFS family arabinose efflux permease